MKILSKNTLISSILFFVLGVVLLTNPSLVVKSISYVFGGVLLLVGIYKVVNYCIQNKRLQVVNYNEMAFGITAIILGLVFIFLASAIEFLIRVVFGAWMIVEGISKIGKTFYTTDRTSKFYALIVVGLLFVGAGIYTILSRNLALQIIGLFMISYGIIDFISYFVYREKAEKVLLYLDKDEKKEVKKKKPKKVMEAEVLEEDK